MGRSIALIANPASGRGRVGGFLPRVEQRLRDAGCTVETLISRSPSHAIELAAGAGGRCDVVAAAGGDGMVHFVVNGLLGTPAALGIVPLGTGNDFAANLGYARRDPLAACAVLASGAERRVDAGKIEGGPSFVCVAGGGFDSEVNRVANRIRMLRGTPVYVAATLRTLARFRPARFTVTLDGKASRMDAMFVAAGNATSYGGGMRITPDARLDDGLFDVTVVGALSRPALLGQFPKLFKGTHVNHPAVTTARAATVTIAADRPFACYADGEEIGPLPVTLTVQPGALRVVGPGVSA
ncbi:MAG TPA: diacylglycerol kinase family protein [Actinomycetota bacterium]|nr:diacylglycerol kinase family protein [Actinomycetota bacterium]